jgi:hypothetical protein
MEICAFTGLVCFSCNVSPAIRSLNYALKVTAVLTSRWIFFLKHYYSSGCFRVAGVEKLQSCIWNRSSWLIMLYLLRYVCCVSCFTAIVRLFNVTAEGGAHAVIHIFLTFVSYWTLCSLMTLFSLQRKEYQIEMETLCVKFMLSKEAGGRGISEGTISELPCREWVRSREISGLKFSYASSIGCMNKGEFRKGGNVAGALPTTSRAQACTVHCDHSWIAGRVWTWWWGKNHKVTACNVLKIMAVKGDLQQNVESWSVGIRNASGLESETFCTKSLPFT